MLRHPWPSFRQHNRRRTDRFLDFGSIGPRRSFPRGISFTPADLIGREISFSCSNLVVRPFVTAARAASSFDTVYNAALIAAEGVVDRIREEPVLRPVGNALKLSPSATHVPREDEEGGGYTPRLPAD